MMIHTLTLNPMVLVHILALAQTIFLAIYVTVPKNAKPKRKQGERTLSFFRHLGLGALSVVGVLLLDAGVMWFFGGWTLTDWRFQLPSVILLIILGLQYVLAILLVKGTVLDIIFIACVAIMFIAAIHVLLPSEVVMGEFLEGQFPYLLAVPIGAYAAIAAVKAWIIERLLEKRENSKLKKISWDFGEPLKKFYGRKTNFVLWILSVAQSILIFFGYSLFTLFS